MILPILQYPDPRLARISEPVSAVTPELRELAANMLETMYARDGIGLAAPQVGHAIRLVVIDITGPEKREEPRVLVNPALKLGDLEVESEEGCLSVPDLRSTVMRSATAQLTATDLDGNPVALTADGMLAICLQHECDHLEGSLFIDRVSRLKRMLYDKKIANKEKKRG